MYCGPLKDDDALAKYVQSVTTVLVAKEKSASLMYVAVQHISVFVKLAWSLPCAALGWFEEIYSSLDFLSLAIVALATW
jgi:hypothetical protein